MREAGGLRTVGQHEPDISLQSPLGYRAHDGLEVAAASRHQHRNSTTRLRQHDHWAPVEGPAEAASGLLRSCVSEEVIACRTHINQQLRRISFT
jgi:hypothetical protein